MSTPYLIISVMALFKKNHIKGSRALFWFMAGIALVCHALEGKGTLRSFTRALILFPRV